MAPTENSSWLEDPAFWPPAKIVPSFEGRAAPAFARSFRSLDQLFASRARTRDFVAGYSLPYRPHCSRALALTRGTRKGHSEIGGMAPMF
jgi:hypothetical protein